MQQCWVLGPQPAQHLERTQTSHQWEGEQKPRKCQFHQVLSSVSSLHTSLSGEGRGGSQVCDAFPHQAEQKRNKPWSEKALFHRRFLYRAAFLSRAVKKEQPTLHNFLIRLGFLPVKSWGGKSLSSRVRNDSYRNRFSSSTGVGRAWHSRQRAWLRKRSSSQKARLSLPARRHPALPHKQRGTWDWELFWPLPREPSSRPILQGTAAPRLWCPGPASADSSKRASLLPWTPLECWKNGRGRRGERCERRARMFFKKKHQKNCDLSRGKTRSKGCSPWKWSWRREQGQHLAGRGLRRQRIEGGAGFHPQSPLWAQPHNLQDPVQNEMKCGAPCSKSRKLCC